MTELGSLQYCLLAAAGTSAVRSLYLANRSPIWPSVCPLVSTPEPQDGFGYNCISQALAGPPRFLYGLGRHQSRTAVRQGNNGSTEKD